MKKGISRKFSASFVSEIVRMRLGGEMPHTKGDKNMPSVKIRSKKTAASRKKKLPQFSAFSNLVLAREKIMELF